MKKILVSPFIFLMVACFSQSTETAHITISTSDMELQSVEIIQPIEQIYLWLSRKKVITPSQEGSFETYLELDNIEIVYIKAGKSLLKMVVEPGHSYHLEVQEGEVTFTGDNAEGMKLLNELPPPYIAGSDERAYKTDSTAQLLRQTVEQEKSTYSQKLEQYLKTEKIDSAFFELMRRELDYLFAGRMTKLVYGKLSVSSPNSDEWEEIWEQTLISYPLEIQPLPSTWTDYTETMLIDKSIFQELKRGTITREQLEEIIRNDEAHTYFISFIHKYLQEPFKEKLLAQYLMQSAQQNRFEKSLIFFFDEFTQTYPQSTYIPYLEPVIDKIRVYHEKIQAEYADNINFWEGEEINSIDELINQFEGQKLYIDMWATWCGPCKEEFRHNESLSKLLDTYQVEKIFISIDKPELEQKWKNDIKYFELKGTHLLANEAFKDHFIKNYSIYKGGFSIPQYLYINEAGEIVSNEAPRPSQLEELEVLLKQ